MDSFLQQLGGQVDSSGRFSLNLDKARSKLSRFQLTDPHEYVCHLVASAVAAGATRVAIYVDADDVVVRHDGRAPSSSQLQNVFASLLDPGFEDTAIIELDIALNTALAQNPAFIAVETGEHELIILSGRQQLKASSGKVTGVEIKVRSRLGIESMRLFTSGKYPELDALSRRCRLCPIPLWVNGKRLDQPFQLPACLASVEHRSPDLPSPGWSFGESRLHRSISGDGFQALLGLTGSGDTLQVLLSGLTYQIQFTPGIEGLVVVENLPRNVSQSEIRQSKEFEELTRRLQSLVEHLYLDLGHALIERPQDFPEVARSWLLHRMGSQPGLRKVSFLQTVDGRRLKVDELATLSAPTYWPQTWDMDPRTLDPIAVLSDAEAQVLTPCLPGLQRATNQLRLAQTAERNRLRYLERQSRPPMLHEEVQASIEVACEEGSALVGVSRRGLAASQLVYLKGGKPLGAAQFSSRFPVGLVGEAEHPDFTPSSAWDGVAPDCPVRSRVEQAIRDALPRLVDALTPAADSLDWPALAFLASTLRLGLDERLKWLEFFPCCDGRRLNFRELLKLKQQKRLFFSGEKLDYRSGEQGPAVLLLAGALKSELLLLLPGVSEVGVDFVRREAARRRWLSRPQFEPEPGAVEALPGKLWLWLGSATEQAEIRLLVENRVVQSHRVDGLPRGLVATVADPRLRLDDSGSRIRHNDAYFSALALPMSHLLEPYRRLDRLQVSAARSHAEALWSFLLRDRSFLFPEQAYPYKLVKSHDGSQRPLQECGIPVRYLPEQEWSEPLELEQPAAVLADNEVALLKRVESLRPWLAVPSLLTSPPNPPPMPEPIKLPFQPPSAPALPRAIEAGPGLLFVCRFSDSEWSIPRFQGRGLRVTMAGHPGRVAGEFPFPVSLEGKFYQSPGRGELRTLCLERACQTLQNCAQNLGSLEPEVARLLAELLCTFLLAERPSWWDSAPLFVDGQGRRFSAAQLRLQRFIDFVTLEEYAGPSILLLSPRQRRFLATFLPQAQLRDVLLRQRFLSRNEFEFRLPSTALFEFALRSPQLSGRAFLVDSDVRTTKVHVLFEGRLLSTWLLPFALALEATVTFLARPPNDEYNDLLDPVLGRNEFLEALAVGLQQALREQKSYSGQLSSRLRKLVLEQPQAWDWLPVFASASGQKYSLAELKASHPTVAFAEVAPAEVAPAEVECRFPLLVLPAAEARRLEELGVTTLALDTRTPRRAPLNSLDSLYPEAEWLVRKRLMSQVLRGEIGVPLEELGSGGVHWGSDGFEVTTVDLHPGSGIVGWVDGPLPGSEEQVKRLLEPHLRELVQKLVQQLPAPHQPGFEAAQRCLLHWVDWLGGYQAHCPRFESLRGLRLFPLCQGRVATLDDLIEQCQIHGRLRYLPRGATPRPTRELVLELHPAGRLARWLQKVFRVELKQARAVDENGRESLEELLEAIRSEFRLLGPDNPHRLLCAVEFGELPRGHLCGCRSQGGSYVPLLNPKHPLIERLRRDYHPEHLYFVLSSLYSVVNREVEELEDRHERVFHANVLKALLGSQAGQAL